MTEVDMSMFTVAKSDQLNADDLIGGPKTITITKVTAAPDANEQPVSIHYEGGEGRPWKPCKTMRRLLMGVWGKQASKYVGRSLTLYRDPTVAFGGLQVGGIRISHMSDIAEDKTVALLVTRGRKAPFKIKPLPAAPASTSADPATNWSNGYIAKLATLPDLAAVEAFEAEKSAKLAELATAKPALHSKVIDATVARKAELAGTTDAFNDDLLGGSGEKTAAETSVDQYKERLEAATTLDEVTQIQAEAQPHIAFLPDDLAVSLEVAIDKAKKRLEPAGAEA